MSMHDRKLRITRRLIGGVTLAFVVSFATAAMVVLLPEAPERGTKFDAAAGVPLMSEYVQLHQARHTVAPSYMHIDVVATTR